MAEKFKTFLRFLDIPSGSVLGVFSGSIICLSVWATLKGKDLPSGVVAAYLGVVAAKTGHSVMTKKGEQSDHAPKDIVG